IDFALACDNLSEFGKLHETDRTLDIRDPKIITDHRVLKCSRVQAPLVAQEAQPIVKASIATNHISAFAGCHCLVCKERKAADISKTADMSISVVDSEALCRVFNDLDAVTRSKGLDRGHIAGRSIEMNRHDGPRARCDQAFGKAKINLKRVWLNVDKDRGRSNQDHRVG